MTYQNWQEKLKSELKTDDLSEKHIKLLNGILYDPFLNPEHIETIEIKLDNFNGLSIGHAFRLKADEETNQLIHNLLANDLRVLRIFANSTTDWAKILDGVYPSLIFMDLEFDDIEAFNRFESYKNTHKDHENWRLSVSLTTGILENHNPRYFNVLDYRKFGIENQVSALKALLEYGKSHSDKCLKLRIDIGENLLESIPYVRAINSIMDEHCLNTQFMLEANHHLKSHDSSIEVQLIRAGSIAMWSAMAGVNQLYFDEIKDTKDYEYARLILNIQNLMSLESHMDGIQDPLFGSYIIEDLTQKLLAEAYK